MQKMAVLITLFSLWDGNNGVVKKAWEGNVSTFTLEIRMYLFLKTTIPYHKQFCPYSSQSLLPFLVPLV